MKSVVHFSETTPRNDMKWSDSFLKTSRGTLFDKNLNCSYFYFKLPYEVEINVVLMFLWNKSIASSFQSTKRYDNQEQEFPILCLLRLPLHVVFFWKTVNEPAFLRITSQSAAEVLKWLLSFLGIWTFDLERIFSTNRYGWRGNPRVKYPIDWLHAWFEFNLCDITIWASIIIFNGINLSAY